MTLPAWTFSGLETFATCPKKFYHLKVARDTVDPPNEHTEWGKRVHDAMEYRVKEGRPLPEGMRQWESLATKLLALSGDKLTEHKFAVDRAFQPTSWDKAWSRGIADLVIVHRDRAIVADYKTGKRKPTDQLQLYAAYVFAHMPDVNKVYTAFVWLKERTLDTGTICREDVRPIHMMFIERVKRLEIAHKENKWPAKPSGLCRAWCPVTTCEFNGKNKNR